jgi:hypothetical protein
MGWGRASQACGERKERFGLINMGCYIYVIIKNDKRL